MLGTKIGSKLRVFAIFSKLHYFFSLILHKIAAGDKLGKHLVGLSPLPPPPTPPEKKKKTGSNCERNWDLVLVEWQQNPSGYVVGIILGYSCSKKLKEYTQKKIFLLESVLSYVEQTLGLQHLLKSTLSLMLSQEFS